jgi:PAS domain S-box-containing protein
MGIDITDRKRAEDALREREYLLSSSQRAAHVGTWSWKIGDTSVYWSDETYRIYGLNPAMGAPSFEFFFDIIHSEDRPKMQEWPTLVIAGLHPPPIEFRVMRPDGIYRVIQTDGDVIETVDGVPSRIAGTAYDITDRKQAEETLRQSEEKFSIMFRKTPFSAALSSISDLKLVEVNEQFEKYWGYSSAEAIGKTSSELGLYPDDDERVRLSATFWEKGFIHDAETKMRTKTGELKDVLINSDTVKIGNGQFVLSTIQNITERKKIDFERHKFVMLADSSSEFIGMCDLNLQPVYVNPSGIRLVGLTNLSEACKVKVQDYFFPEDQQFIAEDFFPRVLSEGDGVIEIRLRNFQTGDPIWVLYYLFRVCESSGTPIGWATVSRDITERKHAEEELKRQLEELRRWHEVTLDREGRVLELKQEVNELLIRHGEALRYANILQENPDVDKSS